MRKSTLVLTGASGFIGHHVLSALSSEGAQVRALTRDARAADAKDSGIEWIVGDLSDHSVWDRLLQPGCTLIDLAYSQFAVTEDAVAVTRAMVAACDEARVSRLIHCSTISVFGRTVGGFINESTPCNPIDDYGRRKLAIEQVLFESVNRRFELAVLRPAAVFGTGGQGLQSLCDSLVRGSCLTNYLRSTLFGRRSMHLVPVATVVAALRFLCEASRPMNGELFIVANDDDPINNFQDVERILRYELGLRDYLLPKVAMPPAMLGMLLRMRGRSEIDPTCVYDSGKLFDWGFVRPISLEDALYEFAAQRRGSGAGTFPMASQSG